MQDTILYCNGDLGNDMCGLHCIVLYCIVYVAYVVFTLCVVLSNDKFHVRLSHDRITDLRNDINMYVPHAPVISFFLMESEKHIMRKNAKKKIHVNVTCHLAAQPRHCPTLCFVDRAPYYSLCNYVIREVPNTTLHTVVDV